MLEEFRLGPSMATTRLITCARTIAICIKQTLGEPINFTTRNPPPLSGLFAQTLMN